MFPRTSIVNQARLGWRLVRAPCFQTSRSLALFKLAPGRQLLVKSQPSSSGRLLVLRHFHVTAKCQSPLPAFIFLYLMTRVAKVGAMVFGRVVRAWWKSLPNSKRAMFVGHLKRHKILYGLSSGAGLAFAGGYYYTHLEYAPITKRVRFIAFNPERLNEIEAALIDQNDKRLKINTDPNHPDFVRISNIMKRIAKSNSDLEGGIVNQYNWTLKIIEDDRINNASASPRGTIYVYTGLLRKVKDDNTLACIMGHEMAHTMLKHATEKMTQFNINVGVTLFFSLLIWTFVPQFLAAAFTDYFTTILIKAINMYPYDRKMEKEADEVGMQLAARACYDIRKFDKFFDRPSEKVIFEINVKKLDKDGKEVRKKETIQMFDPFATHPSHSARLENIRRHLPAMLQLREKCNCEKLI